MKVKYVPAACMIAVLVVMLLSSCTNTDWLFEVLVEEDYTVEESIDDSWAATAGLWREDTGNRFTLSLSPGGSEYSVWGDGIYTDDSSIGTAAVHAGLITLAAGGTVTVEILGPQESFGGSMRNGVETSTYGPWDGSFRFR